VKCEQCRLNTARALAGAALCRDGLRSSPKVSKQTHKMPGLPCSPSRHKAAPTIDRVNRSTKGWFAGNCQRGNRNDAGSSLGVVTQAPGLAWSTKPRVNVTRCLQALRYRWEWPGGCSRRVSQHSKGKPNASSTRLMLVMVSDRLIEIEI